MRRIFLALTVVFLAATVALAWGHYHETKALRAAAVGGLGPAVDALENRFVATLSEGADALRAWDGSGPPTQTIDWAESVSASAAPETVLIAGVDAAVQFAGDGIHVIVPGEAASTYRRGRIAHSALIDRLEADAAVGLPASAASEREGRYSRIGLVSSDGSTLFLHGAAPKSDDGGGLDITNLFGGSGKTFARKQISHGDAGDARGYKGEDGDEAFGSWRELAAVPGTWALVEIRDVDATWSAAGLPLRAFGAEFAQLFLWHLTLGLGILCLLLTTFLSLQRRGVKYGVLIRVFQFMAPYKWGIVGVVVLGIFYSAAGLVTKVLLVQKLIDDVLVNPGDDPIGLLWTLAGLIAGMSVLLAGAHYAREYLNNYYATAMMADIRLTIGTKIVSLPLEFFARFRSGDLLARIERDAAAMKRVINLAMGTASIQPFELVGAVVTAFVVNSRLALVLLGMPILVWPLFRIAKKIKSRAESRQVLLAEISHVIFQMLVGVKVIKAFVGEKREAERLDKANQRFIGEARRVHRLSALSESLLELMQNLGAAIIFVGGGYLVLGGQVSVGDVTAFIVIVQRAYTASKKLTKTANSVVNATPGTERVFEILDYENSLKDGPREMAQGRLKRGIEFRDVSFAYGEKDVLRDVNLTIGAGEIVAVVGPTGAGKTTLCDLVSRFYDPTEGAILCEGADIREYSVQSLRENIAVVTQDAFLFNATIAENIRYGKADATGEEIRAAAVDAFVHDEIKGMEGSYQKEAGERGSSVSGGQRQRITIARAILKDAPVLILDEATSALDTHAEKQVQAALDKLMSGRTVIVVAHRLSTIRNADCVVVMRDGKIVETGAPADLLDNPDSQFKRMWELQMGQGRDGV